MAATHGSQSVKPLRSMHGYGDSWFSKMNELGSQYVQQQAQRDASNLKLESEAPMHGYGELWFENLNAQRLKYEQRTIIANPEPPIHGYGESWFENLNAQRLEYEQRKVACQAHNHVAS